MNNPKLLALVVATFMVCSFRVNALELPPPPEFSNRASSADTALTLGAQFPGGVRIQEFARVVLQDVLKSQFVFSSEFLATDAVVGFSASSLKRAGSESLLRDVLEEHGFSLDKRAGYYRVSLLKLEDKPDLRKDFIYRLKHRDLSYLSAQLLPLFPPDSFTFTRGIDSGNSQSQSHSDGAVDNGRSLYSMTNKTNGDLILFRGHEPDIERLRSLLSKLDVEVPRVLVRAFVLETRDLEQSGYSVSAVAKLLSGKLGITIAGSTAGNLLTFTSPDFEAVASALRSDSRVRVLTSPSVYAETGASASLSVGSSVPTLGAIQFSNDGQSQQSVEYQDTGVILRITPRVLEESISVRIEQEISDAVQTQTGVSGSPTITKSNIQTAFNVVSGDFVILGGLSSEKSSTARDSFPLFRWLTLGSTSSEASADIVIVLYVERA